MNFTKTRWPGVALGGALALGAVGCVDNTSSLFIQQVQLPDPEDGCVVTNDPQALTLPRGLVDKGLTDRYRATFLVGNQLISRGSTETLRPETSRVQLYQASVELLAYDGATPLAPEYTVPLAGFADQGQGTAPGYGVAFVDPLVDPATLSVLDTANGKTTTVIARVRVFGATLGGLDVETAPWDFPVDVCGQNVGDPRDADSGDHLCIPLFKPADPNNPTQDLFEPCRAGQDTIHHCYSGAIPQDFRSTAHWQDSCGG